MFKINDKEHELSFTLRRIDLIENALNNSIMGIMVKGNGMLKISDLRAIFSYALKSTDTGTYLGATAGAKATDELIKTYGFTNVVTKVIEALERDCPFFFQGD